MSTPSGELIFRHQFESYMNCSASGTPSFNLIGEGFTNFAESKNPKEYARKYINYKTEKTDVIGYSPSIAYSCDVITGDPVVQEIVKITDQELVGTATHRDIVCVNLWDYDESYSLTEDSAVSSSKTYYTRSGSADSYTYTAVTSPSVTDIATYYEKNVAYKAFKRTYAIIPANKGDGTDALIYTGTFKAASDAVEGTFNRDTKAFTASA